MKFPFHGAIPKGRIMNIMSSSDMKSFFFILLCRNNTTYLAFLFTCLGGVVCLQPHLIHCIELALVAICSYPRGHWPQRRGRRGWVSSGGLIIGICGRDCDHRSPWEGLSLPLFLPKLYYCINTKRQLPLPHSLVL